MGREEDLTLRDVAERVAKKIREPALGAGERVTAAASAAVNLMICAGEGAAKKGLLDVNVGMDVMVGDATIHVSGRIPWRPGEPEPETVEACELREEVGTVPAAMNEVLAFLLVLDGHGLPDRALCAQLARCVALLRAFGAKA